MVSGNADGPYRFEHAVSSTELIVLAATGNQERLFLRGLNPTGNHTLDEARRRRLDQYLMGADLYLWKDTSQRSNGHLSAVVLTPTVRFVSHDLDAGERVEKDAHYVVIQALTLELGEALLDRTDHEYSFYKDFLRCESRARQKRNGYWKNAPEK